MYNNWSLMNQLMLHLTPLPAVSSHILSQLHSIPPSAHQILIKNSFDPWLPHLSLSLVLARDFAKTAPYTPTTWPLIALSQFLLSNATCYSSNLIYEYLLTWTQYDVFYVGETKNSLSTRMNGQFLLQQSWQFIPSGRNPHLTSPTLF